MFIKLNSSLKMSIESIHTEDRIFYPSKQSSKNARVKTYLNTNNYVKVISLIIEVHGVSLQKTFLFGINPFTKILR